MTSAAPTVSAIRRESGIAGQYAYAATVAYPGEAAGVVRFVGSTYGGPIIMVTSSGHQVPVSSSVTDRIGSKLTPEWVRAFFD